MKKKRKASSKATTAKKLQESIQAELCIDAPQDERNDESTPQGEKARPLPSSAINALATGSTKKTKIDTNIPINAKKKVLFVSDETPGSDVVSILPPKHRVDYHEIVESLQHQAWKFNGNDLDVFDFKDFAVIGAKSYRILTRNIELSESKGKDFLLFFTDEHIDLFTQFLHRGENSHDAEINASTYLPTPSFLYNELQKDKFDFETCKVANRYFRSIRGELFYAGIIDITVYENEHFSKVFILNAYQVLNRASFRPIKDSDPKPLILIANTLSESGGGGHDESVIVRKVRRFLNQAEKHFGLGGGAAFNYKTMPHQVLKGTSLSWCTFVFLIGH